MPRRASARSGVSKYVLTSRLRPPPATDRPARAASARASSGRSRTRAVSFSSISVAIVASWGAMQCGGAALPLQETAHLAAGAVRVAQSLVTAQPPPGSALRTRSGGWHDWKRERETARLSRRSPAESNCRVAGQCR
jgi:hypothetical protein